MSKKKINELLINTFAAFLLLSTICLLSIKISAQTNPNENSLNEQSVILLEDESVLKETASVYCELARSKKHSDLEKIIASELDYKRESDSIRDKEKKSLESKAAQSAENKESETKEKPKVVSVDLTPLLLLKRDFVLNEFPNFIYELEMTVIKTELVSIKNHEATVRVTFTYDYSVRNYDFHFIKNAEKKWKIYFIRHVNQR